MTLAEKLKELQIEPKLELEKYSVEEIDRYMHKWWHYFEIYERYFSKYKNTDVKILEIGIFGGGSLQMWKKYFGKNAKIYGIDIRPECKKFEEEQIEIYIGSQSDPNFLNDLMAKIGPVDIIIDDGSHMSFDQVASLNILYPHLKENGVYLCEDCHTSYWPEYGGGFGSYSSFIEESKRLIDKLNVVHTRRLTPDFFSQNTHSIHFYDSIVVFEKRKMSNPWTIPSGKLDL